ncbi:hypothetical protein [Pseudomonas rubra]|uniref:Integral membrane protein n=1 Tax=Pseudomonas rubra TaxID=2942627 RepID=A0ABT5P9G9_9PSED|nr:hypothetical protein [Pseudomonas rubra]MDD1014644.1 hypothetical protein [Pseudomonas rubra]MDD1040593.1 hypothetical protein [Pseudomonas rubra]MDD1153563.1 hypothetical protein [Pseudomonas rubra]
MAFRTLTYDVFHLGLYMITALAWTSLCVMVLLTARRRRSTAVPASGLCVAGVGALVCVGILLADVLRLIDHRVVLFSLLVFGVFAPVLTVGGLYRRLNQRRGTVG